VFKWGYEIKPPFELNKEKIKVMNRKGRPQGAKNKLPNNELVNSLINNIVEDLNNNYSKLTTNQKIKILNVLRHKLIFEENTNVEFQPIVITGMQII
jgi:hypothetical protein